MVQSALKTEIVEKRQHSRLDSRRDAHVQAKGGPVPVQVKNWSPAGARLDFDRLVELPPEFKLLLGPKEHGGEPSIRCRLRWRDGSSAGVSFY